MQIQQRMPITRKTAPKRQPASQQAPPSGDTFSRLPSNWQDVDVQPVKLPDSPPPKLPRPVIFMHGFNGSAERWDHVVEWLTSGEEPVNRAGGIIDAGQFRNIDPKANLFSLRLSRPYNSVEKNKGELKETVEAVLKATGADEVDLVVHSLGGLNARHYLQDADEKVNKIVQLGTPNKGSQLANMERFFRDNFNFPVLPPVDDPEVQRVLEQLSVDKLDGDGNPKNPWLRELNNDWSDQREKADILMIAGAGVPTLTGGPGVTVFGDGVVTRRSAHLDGVEKKTSWFRTHGGLQNSAKVMETTAKFLSGSSLQPGEHLFDSARDAVKAAELMSQEKSQDSAPIEKATPQEVRRAKQLPLLDPAFQMGLGLGVLSAMMGGPAENLPLIEIGLKSRTTANTINAKYEIDMEREGAQLTGNGTVNEESFAEVASFQEGKVHWRSAFGLQASGLTVEVGDDEKSISMKGDMAGVPTDLTMNLLFSEEGHMSGIHTTGQFNGEPYSMRSSVDMGGLLKGGPEHHGEMQVTGRVDGEDMQRKYRVNVKNDQSGLQFKAVADENQVNDHPVGVTVNIRP